MARTAVARFARLCGFPESEVSDVSVAAGEALTNAALYGRAQRDGGFSVTCSMIDNELRIEIQDSGAGFDDRNASGFGTIIMRTLMTSITYSRGGTHVRLVKRREN